MAYKSQYRPDGIFLVHTERKKAPKEQESFHKFSEEGL